MRLYNPAGYLSEYPAEVMISGRGRVEASALLAEVPAAMRRQAAICEDMGRQCHGVADVAEQTQHLLTSPE